MYLFFISPEQSEMCPRVIVLLKVAQNQVLSSQRHSARGRVGKHDDIPHFVQGNTGSENFALSKMLAVG